jgi:hypothetical protein
MFSSSVYFRILAVFLLALTGLPVFGDPPRRFVQLEQEGNLEAPVEDARGTFFRYYEPAEHDPALVRRVVEEQGTFRRWLFRAARGLSPRSPEFDLLDLSGKVRYLELLAEKRGGCERKVPCELLRRRKNAPEWLAPHPFFEGPPGAPMDAPVSFWFPEIVSAKDKPAKTPAEAVVRHRQVIHDTGLESPHFHVFVRVPRARLEAQMAPLLASVQRINDDLFLQATHEAINNAMLDVLRPWTAATSERARETFTAGGAAPEAPRRADPHDPKFSFVGLRYWGETDGEVLLSLELRGVRTTYTYEPQRRSMVNGFEEANLPKKSRSFAYLERVLDRLWKTAGELERGTLEAPPHVARQPNLERAEALVAQVARERNVPSPPRYADFLRRVFGLEHPSPGLLFPFSDPHRDLSDGPLRKFVEDFLAVAEEFRASGNNTRLATQQFWGAYDRWVRAEEAYLARLSSPVRPANAAHRCRDDLGQL